MPSYHLDRRTFLTLPLALLLAPLQARAAEPGLRRGQFAAEVSMLFGALTFHLAGPLEERVDRAAGRYEVTLEGRGTGVSNRMESRGVLRNGRWAPVHVATTMDLVGRPLRSTIEYDYEGRRIEYHHRSETFFLRRVRAVDDVLSLPAGMHVDDAMSATLNYADGLWPSRPDGSFETHVVRRRRREGEGPDDVEKEYRAEIVPFQLKIERTEDAHPAGVFDLTRFSSWARQDKPGRIVFGRDRRPESIALGLILGTSISVKLGPA
ncbi:MAG: hypothetical protein HY294_17830 [Candidatus Rokubacteria bacterium]|nr:hypothetical protein [Candidatus Rokubacteria bacterium]